MVLTGGGVYTGVYIRVCIRGVYTGCTALLMPFYALLRPFTSLLRLFCALYAVNLFYTSPVITLALLLTRLGR